MENKQEEKLTKRYTYTEYLETFVHPDFWGDWYKDDLGQWQRKEKPETITITTAGTQPQETDEQWNFQSYSE